MKQNEYRLGVFLLHLFFFGKRWAVVAAMAVPDGYCLMGKATLQTSGEYKGIRDVIAKYSDAKFIHKN